MQLSADVQNLFIFCLVIVTIGSTFLSIYSISNVARLRNTRMNWKTGKLAGYPLFATLFLAAMILLGGLVYQTGLEQHYAVVGCYGWVGFNWFAASFLASKSYITDHGIVKNINDPSQTVAWHEIRDYVEKESEGGARYIFLYRDQVMDGRSDKSCIRLDLFVPPSQIEEFRKIVSYKLGKSLSPSFETIHNVKTTE